MWLEKIWEIIATLFGIKPVNQNASGKKRGPNNNFAEKFPEKGFRVFFFVQCVTEPLFKQNEKYFRSNTARGPLGRMFVYPRKAGVEGAGSICNPVSCYFFLIGFSRFAFQGKLISNTKTLLSLKIEVLRNFSIHYYSQVWKIGWKLHSKDLNSFALKLLFSSFHWILQTFNVGILLCCVQ